MNNKVSVFLIEEIYNARSQIRNLKSVNNKLMETISTYEKEISYHTSEVQELKSELDVYRKDREKLIKEYEEIIKKYDEEFKKVVEEEKAKLEKDFEAYLKQLLKTLIEEGESFSSKRPFGDSGWMKELYTIMINEGLIEGELDQDGYLVDTNYNKADQIIIDTIRGWK